MVIDERTVGRVTVVTPHERLTVETFGELKNPVRRLAEDGRTHVVVNLSAVAYVDSIGVAELVRAHVMLEGRGGRLSLSHLHRTVSELLELTGLTDVLDIFTTEAEAVQSYVTPSGDQYGAVRRLP